MKNKITILLVLLCLTACKPSTPVEMEESEGERLQSVTCYSGGTVILHDEGVVVEYISQSAVWYNLSDGTRVRARADCIVKDM